MRYAEYALTDLGYRLVETGLPLPEIWGLDNIDDQRFEHVGVAGYPPSALMCLDRPDRSTTLAIFDGAALPEGVTEILAVDVVALLVAEYGWPEGTTLVDGLPVRPRE